MKSVSLRLRKDDLEILEKLAKEKKKDRSEVARELIESGHMFDVLRKYKDGVLSIENAAQELKMSVGDFMDLLSELWIRSPVSYEDYKEGIKSLERVFG